MIKGSHRSTGSLCQTADAIRRSLAAVPIMTSVTTPAVPESPLPQPQYVRVAVIGQPDALTAALVEAFTAAGRRVEQFTPEALMKEPRGVSRSFEVAFVTIDSRSLESVLPELAHVFAGVVVVVCTTSLDSDEQGYFMRQVPKGGATGLAARLLPNSRVVGALQQFGAEHLTLATLGTFHSDVPVIGDDREASDLVEALIDELRGLESVYTGRLSAADSVEGLATVVNDVARDLGRPVGFRLSASGLKILD
jgi:predicted dinucleotide-binding enzyme